MAADKNKKDPEIIAMRKEEQALRSKRRGRQILGFAMFVLMVVGALSIFWFIYDVYRDMTDTTSEYEEYSQRITPLVWFDLLPFESLETADPNALKQVAIWGVMSNIGMDNLERDENGQPLISAVEVDRYAAALFGPEYKLEHGAFEDKVENLSYQYDPASEMYTAQATSLTPLYLPSIQEIKNEAGGIRRVTVGYVSTRGSNNEIVAAPDLEHPAKYMDFLFRRDGSNYYLYALQTNTSYAVPAASSAPAAGVQSLPDSLAPASLADSGASGAAGDDSAENSASDSFAESEEAASEAGEAEAGDEAA